MEVRARQIQGGRIFAKVEFVRYCVEYLYSPVTMRLELFVRYCVEYLYSQVTMGLELYLAV
jgi:hypothetical protein